LLGAPIGSITHMQSYVRQKMEKSFSLMNEITQLNDSQIAFSLLHYCCGFGKIVFFLRTIPPPLLAEVCIEFDRRVLLCFESISGISLDSAGHDQASLPLSSAGLGLRKALIHSSPAYLASAWFASKMLSFPIALFQESVEIFNSLASPSQFPTPVCRQKKLSSLLDELV